MRTNRLAQVSLAILMAGCITTATQAGERVYKWTDENGVVHFGQQPPTTTQSEELQVQQGYSRKSDAVPEPAINDDTTAAQAAATCQRARDNLAALSAQGELKRQDEYGEVHIMTAAEIEAEKTRAQAAIERVCRPSANGEAAPAPATTENEASSPSTP